MIVSQGVFAQLFIIDYRYRRSDKKKIYILK